MRDHRARLAQPISREGEAAWLVALIVSIAATAVYIGISDWPLGTHFDESKKVYFILSGEQDFEHPLLLLQTARIANHFLGYAEPTDVLRLGRAISGIFGGLLVLATFVLGRLVVAPATAVAAAAAVAVTPLIVFHATFLKEDIYFAGPAVFGLAGLLVFLRRPTRLLAVCMGLALGVAASAKFVALLFLVYVIAIVLTASKGSLGARFRQSGLILAAASLVFVVINSTALVDYGTSLQGVDHELSHAISGHDVALPIWLTGGVMHLRDSLLPGLGVPLLIVGLAGLLSPVIDRTHRRALLVIVGAALLWYLAHELSPLKPYPDFARYMVPEGPLLIVVGAAFLEAIVARRATRWAAPAASTTLLLCAVPAAYASYRIISASAHDPRRIVPEIVDSLGPQSFIDHYATFNVKAVFRGDQSQPPLILVTSSFWYERFARHGNDSSQTAETRTNYDAYYGDPQGAFRKPYLEISNGGPSFSYLNPVIRIVALDGDIERLTEIRRAVIDADPSLQIKCPDQMSCSVEGPPGND